VPRLKIDRPPPVAVPFHRMHRYRYPIINEFWRTAGFVGRIAGALVIFVLSAEFARVAIVLYRLKPAFALVYAIVLALVAGWLLLKFIAWRGRARVLFPPPLPPSDRASHDDLSAYCRFLVARLKRFGALPHLDPDQRKSLRQGAYDIEGVLGAHPLRDDLVRTIAKTHQEVLGPMFAVLDERASECAHCKMTAMVEDVAEPPFPVINPIVVLYHHITLVSCIVDTYVDRPTLAEYRIVIGDVWNVVSGGDFFRIGQRLFEGVYASSPPMGSAIEDLGQALSSIWLTEVVAQAAIRRCRALRPWDLDEAMAELDQQTVAMLQAARDVALRDALPMLKPRIRHTAGPGVADAAGFSEQVVQGIAKSVDSVLHGLRTRPPDKAISDSRRTRHGLPGQHAPTEPPPLEAASRPRRSGGAWKRRGLFGLFRTFGERLHYSSRARHLHD
jgi:hypothetical protein